ncbi:MAG: signal peptidase I [Oscillospiraceae bacterium]
MKIKQFVKEWVIPLVIEILLVFMFIKFVAFIVFVPTGSMIPTIDEISVLVATRVYNPESSIERGDIVAFESDELNKVLIKRCVGLPGDTIELDENGKMTLNGKPFEEAYVVNQEATSGEFKVPEDCYLFLGDNRDNSIDARYWDDPYIEGDKIVGEARFTLYPFRNFGLLK